MTRSPSRPITIFTPSDANADNANAQALTVKELVSRLPEERFHVTMLCDGNTPDPRLRARRNTQLVRWASHGNTLRLLRHCLFPPPDIYFFPRTGPLDRVFFGLRKHMKLNTALITYIVMAMDEVTGRGLVGRSILEGDRVFGNSTHVADTIQQMFGIKASPIYDGVDRRYFFACEKQVENINLRVLYAGSLQPRKRVEFVIRQAARLPGVHFRIAGKGETDRALHDLAHELGCRNVSFLGHLLPEQLGQEMQQSDIFLFPSILEGNPQVLLQSAACGLPAIAMDLYRSEYVINGRSGFLAQSDAELSARLDQLVGDAALRRSFSAAAVRHAHQFDWEKISEQWAAVFEEAAQRRRTYSQPRLS